MWVCALQRSLPVVNRKESKWLSQKDARRTAAPPGPERRRTRGAHPVGTGIGAAAGGIAAEQRPVRSRARPCRSWRRGWRGRRRPRGQGRGRDDRPDRRGGLLVAELHPRAVLRARLHLCRLPPGLPHGWEARARYAERNYEDIEHELESHYNRNRGDSRLGWEKNRHAARAAWSASMPGPTPSSTRSNASALYQAR